MFWKIKFNAQRIYVPRTVCLHTNATNWSLILANGTLHFQGHICIISLSHNHNSHYNALYYPDDSPSKVSIALEQSKEKGIVAQGDAIAERNFKLYLRKIVDSTSPISRPWFNNVLCHMATFKYIDLTDLQLGVALVRHIASIPRTWRYCSQLSNPSILLLKFLSSYFKAGKRVVNSEHGVRILSVILGKQCSLCYHPKII